MNDWIVGGHTVCYEYRCIHCWVAPTTKKLQYVLCRIHTIWCWSHPRLTERVGAVGVGRRRRLFGVQCVSVACSLVWACEGIQGWFSGDRASGGATGRMQTSRGRRGGGGMRGKLLLLHQQRLVQLTLVLLDLLLHVGDCTCNLRERRSSGITMYH